MSGALRVLGWVVVAVGLGTAAIAGWFYVSDVGFGDVAAAYGRHPEHPLFQAEYWAAAGRHYGLLAAVVGGLFAGLVFGGMLLGIAALLRRLPTR